MNNSEISVSDFNNIHRCIILNHMSRVFYLTKLITNTTTMDNKTELVHKDNDEKQEEYHRTIHTRNNIQSKQRVTLPTIKVHTNVPNTSNVITRNKITDDYHKVPQTPTQLPQPERTTKGSRNPYDNNKAQARWTIYQSIYRWSQNYADNNSEHKRYLVNNLIAPK